VAKPWSRRCTKCRLPTRTTLTLKRLDGMLADKQFLIGDRVNEANLRLFPSLFRHDPIYSSRFKLNLALLWEYSNLWQWMGDEINLEAVFVGSTLSIPLIHLSLRAINTSFAQITDFSRPHTVFQTPLQQHLLREFLANLVPWHIQHSFS
jgi:hypothetical protein